MAGAFEANTLGQPRGQWGFVNNNQSNTTDPFDAPNQTQAFGWMKHDQSTSQQSGDV